jgi:ribosomal protein S18 acetylase RimI-like enzyme
VPPDRNGVVMSSAEAIVRAARPADVGAICRFGEAHIPAHYAPLIGADAADRQVRMWWTEEQISAAVAAGLVVVAEFDGQVVGVGQRGRRDVEHVIYKLYLDPAHRGCGLGPRLIDGLVDQLPDTAQRIWVEHFAANERAGAFYEREGFRIEHIEPGQSADPRLAVVWRVRDIRRSA